jgi:hypothetical protein
MTELNPSPAELDVSGYPVLRELAARGWSRADLEALTGRDVLRVLRDAEEQAAGPLRPPLRWAGRRPSRSSGGS